MKKLPLILGCSLFPVAFAASCESLASLTLPDTAMTMAQVVPLLHTDWPCGQGAPLTQVTCIVCVVLPQPVPLRPPQLLRHGLMSPPPELPQ